MIFGILFAILIGLSWAGISMMMSAVAHSGGSVFLFYLIGNAVAAVIAWLLIPDWNRMAEMSGMTLLSLIVPVAIAGLVNVASQAMMVWTLKLGHNGISIAVRNCAAVIPFSIGFLFWGNRVGLLNLAGLLMILTAMVQIALNSRKREERAEKRFPLKWLLAMVLSLSCSGSFQVLNSMTARISPELLQTGIRIPLLLTSCAIGNGVVYLLIQRNSPGGGTVPRFFRVMVPGWSLLAILSYFFMFRALDMMNRVEASALVFPIVTGVNISTFSLYSRFRLREPYSAISVCSLLLCALGIIFLTWK